MEHSQYEKHCKTLTCVNLSLNSSSFLLFMVDIPLKIIKNVFKIKNVFRIQPGADWFHSLLK